MAYDHDDDSGVLSAVFGQAGSGLLRLTLLFGSAAVALALFAAPLLDRQGERRTARTQTPANVDPMATGSVGRTSSFTIRRSVLQEMPQAYCVIDSDGTRRGDC